MATKQERNGLVTTLTGGMKDIPRNASWLMGKALSPGHGSSNGSGDTRAGLVDTAKQAGWTLRGAMPGQDSVEARLGRARSAAERAHQAEQDAVEAAQHAHDLAEEADSVAEQEQGRLQDVEREQAAAVEATVAEERRRADEKVAEARRAAEADAGGDVPRLAGPAGLRHRRPRRGRPGPWGEGGAGDGLPPGPAGARAAEHRDVAGAARPRRRAAGGRRPPVNVNR